LSRLVEIKILVNWGMVQCSALHNNNIFNIHLWLEKYTQGNIILRIWKNPIKLRALKVLEKSLNFTFTKGWTPWLWVWVVSFGSYVPYPCWSYSIRSNVVCLRSLKILETLRY
jgi:hypothetical protein